MKDVYKVYRIANGTVIDHIPAGAALKVISILSQSSDDFIAIGMNLESNKSIKKDIIKYENKFLAKEETDKLALLAPGATINIIKNGAVAEKRKINLPEILKNIVSCINPNCVSSIEKIDTEFYLSDIPKKNYRCKYCEREFEIKAELIK